MTGDDQTPTVRIECAECRFEQTFTPRDGDRPAAQLREHARETGHQLSITRLDGDG